ncbi:hypothetical protein E0F15_11165 [Frankia sp. B2]|uniref:hypothetical protein n=1 Tax=Frankia sp. B2 TaxID=2541730 RepID=UPI00106A267B|nr:hypothetical protein [Frankia sp. B2]TFE31034.1 hypothetical protein E0F15_11165 [Frankia sp. B2]
MTRAFVIPADETVPCRIDDVDLSDQAVHELLGGTTESCLLDLINAMMITRGGETPAPFNPRATALLAFHRSPFTVAYRVDGDAVVFDASDDPHHLDTSGVTRLHALLQAPALQIRTRRTPSDAWEDQPHVYTGLDEALAQARTAVRLAVHVAPGSTDILAVTVRPADITSAPDGTPAVAPHPHS